jgi:hypothetical protein
MLLVTLALKTLLSISQNGVSPITSNKQKGNHLNMDIVNASISFLFFFSWMLSSHWQPSLAYAQFYKLFTSKCTNVLNKLACLSLASLSIRLMFLRETRAFLSGASSKCFTLG